MTAKYQDKTLYYVNAVLNFHTFRSPDFAQRGLSFVIQSIHREFEASLSLDNPFLYGTVDSHLVFLYIYNRPASAFSDGIRDIEFKVKQTYIKFKYFDIWDKRSPDPLIHRRRDLHSNTQSKRNMDFLQREFAIFRVYAPFGSLSI